MRLRRICFTTFGVLIVPVLVGHTLSAQIYHAKIVGEGNTQLPGAPLVTAKYSNRLVPFCATSTFGNGTVEYLMNRRAQEYDIHTSDACPVVIKLKGYRSTEATLRPGAVIELKRIGDPEGSTVSMTSLKAPADARKDYDKGVGALSQGKWPAAQKSLESAVAKYPEYVQAWSNLGEALVEQAKVVEARAAWEKALEVDPKYLRSYLQLARLDLSERKYDHALELTNRAIEFKSTEFPGIYFLNAVANFNLKRIDAAERSARRTIELDNSHEIPRAESLLGAVLAAKGDAHGAIEHFNQYLKLSPKAADAAEIEKQIAKLQSSGINPK